MLPTDPVPAWLYGLWRLQNSEPGIDLQRGTRMEFCVDGELRYIIPLEGKEVRFALEYHVEGNTLHTSHEGGRVNVVRFSQVQDGLLELDFLGVRAWFRREERH